MNTVGLFFLSVIFVIIIIIFPGPRLRGPGLSGIFPWPDYIKIKRLIGITGPRGSEM